MQLVSIADLQRPDEELEPILQHAKRLGELWLEFVKQDDQPYDYTVHDGGERNRSSGIHASEMSKCMLKMVYSIMGVERRVSPDAVDANMKFRFRTGTAIHSMVQSDFKRMAEWYNARNMGSGLMLGFESELSIRGDIQQAAEAWGLSSHCDGLFTFYHYRPHETHGLLYWAPFLRVICEIKTSSDKAYDDRKKPESDHLEQTTLYQACLDVPITWLLYYNKSNSNFTTPYSPWLFKFDRHLWENELEMRFAKAHHHAETRQMPQRTEGKHCSWCPFAWLCDPQVLKRQQNNYQPVISPGMLVRK